MAGRRALPDVRVRVKVDDSDLRRAASQQNALGRGIKTSLDQATPSIQRAEQSFKRLNAAAATVTATTGKQTSALQTATSMHTSFGGALTHEERAYAKLQLSSKEFQQAEGAMEKKTLALASSLGQAGEKGAGLFERMTQLGGTMGAGGPTGLAIGAGVVGLGLLVEGAGEAVRSYVELTDHIREYSTVTGESAQEASRQIGAFKELGVDSEKATMGMLRLGRSVASNPEKFQALGIEIAHTKNGTVDLNETLLRVADAYNHTSDATTRAQIVYQSFGKAGVAMIPVLEAGRKQLAQLEAQVSAVFSQADIERAREYQIHMRGVAERVDDLKSRFGSWIAGGVDAEITAFSRADYVSRKMDEAQRKGIVSAQAGRGAHWALAQQYGREFDAAQKAQESIDLLSDAMNRQAQYAADADRANQAYYTSALDLFSAQTALDRANRAVAGSADHVLELHIGLSRAGLDLKDKQQALAEAIKKYGGQSDEAARATLDLRDAQVRLRDASREVQGSLDDQRDTYLNAASNAADLAEKIAGLSGAHFDAKNKAQAFIDKLHDEEKGLAPNSPLRKALDDYIKQLREGIPEEVTTEVVLARSNVIRTGHPEALQMGGPVQPNRDYLVGERGPEILRMGSGYGQVIPNHQLGAVAGSTVTVGPIYAAQMSAYDIGKAIAWEMKTQR